MDASSRQELRRQRRELLLEQRKINQELLDEIEADLATEQPTSTEPDTKGIKEEDQYSYVPTVDLTSPSPEPEPRRPNHFDAIHLRDVGERQQDDERRSSVSYERRSRPSHDGTDRSTYRGTTASLDLPPEPKDDDYIEPEPRTRIRHPESGRFQPVVGDEQYRCITRDIASLDLVELACCFCGGNSSTRATGEVFFLHGAQGLATHIHMAHPSQAWPGMGWSSVVERCTKKTLTLEEEGSVRNGSYRVARVMAAAAEPTARVRQPRVHVAGIQASKSAAAGKISIISQVGEMLTLP